MQQVQIHLSVQFHPLCQGQDGKENIQEGKRDGGMNASLPVPAIPDKVLVQIVCHSDIQTSMQSFQGILRWAL